jgi:iron complex outermembrane receptor protein
MIISDTDSRIQRRVLGLQSGLLACGLVLAGGVSAQNAAESSNSTSTEPETLDQVVVTGTMIHGAQPTGSELVTLDRSAIVATGAQSTTNLLTNLPQIASFNNLPIGTSDFANPIPRFNIRNSGGTLVLLNGHRMVGAGILQTTPDPSAIPVSMIQRVEVLPDGASATYGADAVGGVVNFILRDHFDGAETRLDYGTGHDYHEYDLSQLFGKSWGSGNIMLSYEYTSHTNISYGDRSFYNNDVSALGGKNHFIANCSPPNIVVAGTSYAPPGYAPGKTLCDPTRSADLLPYEHRSTWFLNGRQSITDHIELTGDAFYSTRDQTNNIATSNSIFTLPSTNPFFAAPPGVAATTETVDYRFNREFGNTRRSEVDISSSGVSLSLHVELPSEWHATLTGNYGKATNFARTPAVDGVALAAAATATTPDAAFDPFTGKTSAAVLSAIGGGGVSYTADQYLKEGALNLDGRLFELPAGAVRLAVGTQLRWESLSGVPYQLVNGSAVGIPNGPQAGSRRDIAEFGELFVPIVGTANEVAGIHKLVLSIAGRRDDYSDFGSTTNPKFSVDYAPIESLTLHATASTSFQAPSLADMRSVDTRLQTQPNAPFTPSGALTVPEIYIAGGTPTLQPQTARTYTAGFDLAPPSSPFNAGATYWHSKIKQQIALAFPTQVPLFTNPAFSTFWWGPGGQPLTSAVLDSLLSQFRVDAANAAFTPAYRQALINGGYIVDLRRKNLGQTTIDGIDFHVGYNWEATPWGDWNASVSGVRELHRLSIPGPGAPQADLSATDPQIQGRASLDWTKGPWSSGFNLNVVGPYTITGTDVGSYRARSFTTADARVTWHTPDSAGFFLGQTEITLQATNLFDRHPPFVLATLGYANGQTAHSNPIGRLVSLSLLKHW